MPKWRMRRGSLPVYEVPQDLRDSVNTALHLRRPLLLTGSTGSGKSTLMAMLAHELDLDEVLPWHITSKSVLNDGLYTYDALDRLQGVDANAHKPPVEHYITLGPLGTALASGQPRAVLIDEIDKSDLDLPGDLLNILETGEFEILPLIRAKRLGHQSDHRFKVRGYDGKEYDVGDGKVAVDPANFPVIVFTSNQERAFAAPFLRRCVRYTFEKPDQDMLVKIVSRHLEGEEVTQLDAITEFSARLESNDELATNQLLELIHLVAGHRPDETQKKKLLEILFKPLNET